jgi:hypothetical protein
MNLKVNVIKTSVFLKLIYRFNTTLKEISKDFIVQITKLMLKFLWNYKGPRITTVLKNKDEVGGLTLPDCKTYQKT